jgi:hypothetical protein
MNTLSPSVPAGRHLARVIMASLAVMVLGLLLCAPGAYAETRPPQFIHVTFGLEAYSTRVQIEGKMNEEGLPSEWKAEYSTSCAGPWTEVDKEAKTGNRSGENVSIYIGERDPFSVDTTNYFFRHLTPDTSYCARFTAKNADGEATPEVVPFKTLPVAKPEVEKKNGYKDDGHPSFECSLLSDTAAGCTAEIEGNGAETTYSFEYAVAEPGGGRPAEASGSWKQFTSGATGAITVAEEHADVSAGLSGLAPETTYYVRLKMSNSSGEIVQSVFVQTLNAFREFESFTMPSAKPVVTALEFRNVTATSAVATGGVQTAGSETHWRFEYAESAIGPWSVVPGGEGVISQAQAEARTYYLQVGVAARLTGLSSARAYYVRLFAENGAGEGKFCYGNATERYFQKSCEQVSVADQLAEGFPGSFETLGSPVASTFVVHGLVGERLRLDGGVDPKSGSTDSEQDVKVEGSPTGGTFTLTFGGHTTVPLAYNAPADPIEGPGSVVTALDEMGSGVFFNVEGSVGGPYTIVFAGGVDAGQNVPLIECHSALTPSGSCSVASLLKGGPSSETHSRFQYVSQASFAEHGWAGAEETAEEPVAPGDKLTVVHGLLPVLPAGETYHYRLLAESSIPGVGTVEAGEQTLRVPSFTVQSSPSPCPNEAFRTGLSARLPDCRAYELLTPVDKGGSQEPFNYNAVSGEPAVHVGEDGDHVVLKAPQVSWGSGPGAGGSPYFFSRVAGKGWTMKAGASQPTTGVDNLTPELYSSDLSQFAFNTEYVTSGVKESELIEYKIGPAGGPYTTVASLPRTEGDHPGEWVATNASFSKPIFAAHGNLYEYMGQEGLRQLNVSNEGETICHGGATVAQVSTDGSRVFFYAGSLHGCSVRDLYVRVNGSETIDIGPYAFAGANEQGTVLLLENASKERFGYDSETGKLEPQTSGEQAAASEFATLGIPIRTEPKGDEAFYHKRYTYWSDGAVGSGPVLNGQGESVLAEESQVYRYDDVEHVVECVSCASPYDPNPKQAAILGSYDYTDLTVHGGPRALFASENGEFAFFVTASALVPQDVDGEYQVNTLEGYTDVKGVTSLSTDVYEWRAAGVDGCAAVQGCVALITDGRGGYLNALLGVAEEGREAFVYTNSKLLPQDVDSAGDIYAVRVDGGFAPPPPRPTECEGDACSTPPPAPNDATPSSLTFNGSGNVVEEAVKAATQQRSLTRAQKLAVVLKACRKEKRRRKRMACEHAAHVRYGTASSKAARTGRRGRSGGSARRGK